MKLYIIIINSSSSTIHLSVAHVPYDCSIPAVATLTCLCLFRLLPALTNPKCMINSHASLYTSIHFSGACSRSLWMFHSGCGHADVLIPFPSFACIVHTVPVGLIMFRAYISFTVPSFSAPTFSCHVCIWARVPTQLPCPAFLTPWHLDSSCLYLILYVPCLYLLCLCLMRLHFESRAYID